jgi:hypothetical protein
MKRKTQLILIILLNSFCASAQDTTFLSSFQSGYIPYFVQNKIGLLVASFQDHSAARQIPLFHG